MNREELSKKYNQPESKLIEALQKICGEVFVFTDEEVRNDYGHDQTEDLLFKPSVVVKPRTPEEISEILKLANRDNIAVTPRAGTGSVVEHCLCMEVSLFLWSASMPLLIDEQNLQCTVEQV